MFNHILNYANATIVVSLISFLTLPFFTRYLSPEDFGILAIYTMFGSLLANFLSIGLQAATVRYYYKEKNNIENFQSLNFTNFIFIILSLSIGGLFVYKAAPFISMKIFKNKVSDSLLILSFFGGSITFLFTYLKQLLVAQARSKEYAILAIFSSLLAPLISICLILFSSMTYDARIFGYIATHLIFLFILILMQKDFFALKWSTKLLKKSIGYSYPNIPQQAIGVIQESFDKTLLTNMKSLDMVGHYQIGQRIGNIAKTFISVFGAAWMPFFMERAEKGDKNHKSEIVSRYHEISLFKKSLPLKSIDIGKESVKN